MKVTEIVKDRMFGCLYGQAIGDALDLGSKEFVIETIIHQGISKIIMQNIIKLKCSTNTLVNVKSNVQFLE